MRAVGQSAGICVSLLQVVRNYATEEYKSCARTYFYCS